MNTLADSVLAMSPFTVENPLLYLHVEEEASSSLYLFEKANNFMYKKSSVFVT